MPSPTKTTKRPLRRARLASKLLLSALVGITTFAAFWLGLVPQRYSPFAPIRLDVADQWFIDPRLAALRRDRDLCRAVLKAPHATASPISDKKLNDGCGWINAVRVVKLGGANLTVGRITCEMTAAMALWIDYVVQPAAERYFGTNVARVQQMGTYSCRNIIGSNSWRNVRSQHATANAIDVRGFELADGNTINVKRDWRGSSKKARFLRRIHAESCRYFRASLSPNFNAAHHDHFHFDRGLFNTCR